MTRPVTLSASALILAQVAIHQGRDVYLFTRPGDTARQELAREIGTACTGDVVDESHPLLDAAIIFAPVGALVLRALRAIVKGGRVVCAGIHMTDIPQFPYEWLWGERQIGSVANLTPRDGEEFFQWFHAFRFPHRSTPIILSRPTKRSVRCGKVRLKDPLSL